jgi:hypothetical protein
MENLDPATKKLIRFFRYDHLPEGPLRDTSRMFGALAADIIVKIPGSAERTVALRKLLESKDCAVRAMLPDED